MTRYLLNLALLLLALSCQRGPGTYEFPQPIDTADKPLNQPTKTDFQLPNGLTLNANFPAARLSNATLDANGNIIAQIEPENSPINVSPWYAFTITTPRDTAVSLTLNYPPTAYHRYWPKLSRDGSTWARIDSLNFSEAPRGRSATLHLTLPAGQPIWVAAQEIHDAESVRQWARELADRHTQVNYEVIGQSRLGRDIPRLTLTGPATKRLPTVVLFSRQHPPEVTGYLAFQSFIEGLLQSPRLAEFLQHYQVIIYPLLNPDGVDLGHWRHNAGGVDLNRDWAYYRQPETALVAEDVVSYARKQKSQIVLGLDFHSTWNDVYYTHDNSVQPPSVLGDFKDRWLAAIEREIGGDFRINEEAEPIGRPTSMSWFRTQFNAEGITYEIGDNTPRAFIQQKGTVSADALITELLRSTPGDAR